MRQAALTNVLICCLCPNRLLPENFQQAAKCFPRHVTVIHPFEVPVEIGEGYYQPAQEVIKAIDLAIAGVEPFTLTLTGLKVYLDAAETSWVVSLEVAPSAELDLIRSHCVKHLDRYINREFLFDFHLTVAKDLTERQSRAYVRNYAKAHGNFQPIKVPVSSINIYTRSQNDEPWRTQAYRRLKP